MSASATQALITGALTDYGGALLIIFGAVLTVAVGVLVFNYGWRRVKGSTR